MNRPSKKPIDLYIAEQVKAMRLGKHYSQAAIAAKLGVSDSFIGQIESPNHRSKYSLLQLNDLAHIFGCSPRDFLPEKPL